MMREPWAMTGAEVAGAVTTGSLSAAEAVASALSRIEALDSNLGAFTAVTAERARARAAAIDRKRAEGAPLGALAGVPFSVKNLFDVEGVVTLAGSKINADRAPAAIDAALVRRLEAADAVLVGSVNMGEYAYDFTGENSHWGASRNPHDPAHMSGGSSGGSGAAVAAGLTQLSLGSDTNGSIRVPSSFCGLFGLKPTYGRLSRAGAFPFVGSLDHLGPIARSAEDLALAYDAMQGDDPEDPAQTRRAVEPTRPDLGVGLGSLRIALADGYFARGAEPEALAAAARVAEALGGSRRITLPHAERARAAAYLITMGEAAALHAERLATRAGDFDPAVRSRLLAGAMIPAVWLVQAQKFRRWFRDAVVRLFDEVDVILAPATPCRAPRLGQKTMTLDGVEMAVRPNIGIFTQPISFIGLPVVVAPTWPADGGLPIGVQIIAAPWREDIALRIAHVLQSTGIARAPVAFGGAT
jgi:AtzE family amidohydrolase